jgi:hypothetical protein
METTMIALMSMVMSNTLRSAYEKLSAAHNGSIPDSIRKDVTDHGMDLTVIESDL